MKKISFILALVIGSLTTMTAQTTFTPGDIEFATGVGLLSVHAKDGAQSVVPPVSARMQVRLSPNFSLGAYAAYTASELNDRVLPDGTTQNISNKTFVAGLRSAAHVTSVEKWDFYGGLLLGYSMPNVDETIDGQPKSVEDEGPTFRRPAENNFMYSAFMGATFYPTKHFGVFGEVGYDVSILTVGLSVKL
jgi:hypothetical protein